MGNTNSWGIGSPFFVRMSRKETPTTAGHRAGPEGGSESQVSSPSEDCKFVNAAHPEAVSREIIWNYVKQ